MSPVFILVLVCLLTVPEGFVQGDHALNMRCQCIVKETRRFGRYLGRVEVYPANSHCNEREIIATLKNDGRRICLDPNSPWVKRILSRNLKNKQLKKPTKE